MASKKSYFLVSTVIIFAILYCGFLGGKFDPESISKNLISKQKEVTDMSYNEKMTMFIGNNPTTTESNYLIKKPDMYKRVDWVNSSIYFTVVSNGRTTWGYDPIKNIAYSINNTSQSPLSNPPTYIEFFNDMSNNYTTNYKGIEYLEGVQAYKLEIFPSKQNGSGSSHYFLWVDPKIWMPLKIQSYSGDKLLMTLEYENYSINSGIKDTEFEFKTPKGATVVDI